MRANAEWILRGRNGREKQFVALTFINVNREPFLASFGREVRLDCRCAEIESACLKISKVVM